MSLLNLLRSHRTECEQCGDDLLPHRKKVVNGTFVFCSPDCEEEYLEDNIIVVPQELPLEYNQQQLELSL
jgi:hypothetical protein